MIPVRITNFLPYDILWYIFTLNSSDADEETLTRLNTTRQSSQVCAEWRYILLGAPSIWRRLLVFDDREKWRNTVLSRAKDAPLWVSANSSSLTDDAYCLFLKFLDSHWERIESLDAKLGKSAAGDRSHIQAEKEMLRITQRRAPLLKSFAVSFDIGSSNGLLPFSCEAPLLDTLICKVYRTPLTSQWNSNIRTLSCFFDGTVEETLHLLRSMPFLEKVDLSLATDDERESGTTTTSLPTTELPFLTSFQIRTSLRNFLILKDHLILPDPETCGHVYRIEMDSGDRSLPRLLEDLGTTLQKRIKSTIESMNPRETMLRLDYTSEYLSLGMKGINMAIKLSWSGIIPTNDIFKRILNAVHSPYLETVTSLRLLESHFEYSDVDYTEQIFEFFSKALPSVTHLFAGATFWQSLSRFTCSKNSLFPKLTDVYVDRATLTTPTSTKNLRAKHDADFISCLRNRRDSGLRMVSIFIITSRDPTRFRGLRGIFEEFNGTKVFWFSGRLVLEYDDGWNVANSLKIEDKLYETIGRRPTKGFTDHYIQYIRGANSVMLSL